MMQVVIDVSVRKRWVGEAVLAVCVLSGCQSSGRLGSEFEQAINLLMSDLRKKGKSVLEEPRMQRMRAACRAMPDMDPTRYRPASESLIRRFQEKGFFRINPLVDVNNLLSAQLRVPLGIYDLNKVPPTVWTYRVGFAGEKYFALGKQEKNADGKLVLADPAGVLGSPVADSGRAPISIETGDAAVVAFLPFETTHSEADALAREMEASFAHYFNPKQIECRIVLSKE